MGKKPSSTVVFHFCMNERRGDRRCCARSGANDLRKYAKRCIEESGCKAKVKKADCVGYCSRGPVVEVEPGRVFYKVCSEADVDALLNAHLEENVVAKRLLIGKKKS